MIGGLKAIETVYNGYRFRSRLEARWAVFFDTLGVKYQYEPEGFDLGAAGRYLPDFWLPDQECWIEIKPSVQTLSEADRKKMAAFAEQSPADAFVFYSDLSCPGEWKYDLERGAIGGHMVPNNLEFYPQHDARWLECTDCLMDGIEFGPVHRGEHGDEWAPVIKDGKSFVGISSSTTWRRHVLGHGHWEDMLTVAGCDDTTHLAKAYLAARQARFEFGEHGR